MNTARIKESMRQAHKVRHMRKPGRKRTIAVVIVSGDCKVVAMHKNALGKDVKVVAGTRGWEVWVRRANVWTRVAHRNELGSAYGVARRWV